MERQWEREIEGEWEIIIKKWIKILKKEYLNEVVEKIECLIFGIL